MCDMPDALQGRLGLDHFLYVLILQSLMKAVGAVNVNGCVQGGEQVYNNTTTQLISHSLLAWPSGPLGLSSRLPEDSRYWYLKICSGLTGANG